MDLYTGDIRGKLTVKLVPADSTNKPYNHVLYEVRAASRNIWNKVCLDVVLPEKIAYRILVMVETTAPDCTVLAAIGSIEITPNTTCVDDGK